MSEPIIRTQNLCRNFTMGDQIISALNHVNICVEPEEFLAVMGPSGSGKSTLLYLLGGLDRPTNGEIWVNGKEISQLNENSLASYRGEEIGFIFQAFHLIPTMTALQNVEFPMIFSGIPASERHQRATALLERVGLEERLNHKPTELSGGQQQRVAVARAIANNPQIILADEPTGNLDTRNGKEIMSLLTQLNREEKRTIIIVSHDPTVTDYTTTEIHLLDGKLLTNTITTKTQEVN